METGKEQVMIQRTSVNDQLVRYLQEAILGGKWQVGEKIPSEADLASFFKVSKLTVRVALQHLISLGVLEKRVGDGTYVKAFDFGRYIQQGVDYYMHPGLLDQVCDFRLAIELACCRLAIQNAGEEEFTRLELLSGELAEAIRSLPSDREAPIPEEAFDRIAGKDFEFHRQICLMSHNELLLNAFDMAKAPISQYVKAVFKEKALSRVARGEEAPAMRDIHGEILAALKNRDEAACEEHYIEMIYQNIEL